MDPPEDQYTIMQSKTFMSMNNHENQSSNAIVINNHQGQSKLKQKTGIKSNQSKTSDLLVSFDITCWGC